MPHAASPVLSSVAAEERCSSTSASYSIVLGVRPHRMTEEQRRALAVLMRQKARELNAIAVLLVGDTEVRLAYSNSASGMRDCDLLDPDSTENAGV